MALNLDAHISLDTPNFTLDGQGGGLVFSPPVLFDMGPINPDTQGLQRALFRHYKPHGRGVNVWVLPDGTMTEIQPYPLVTPDDLREGNLPIGNATQVTYTKVWYGGHDYPVTDAEIAQLTAAGYGSYIH